MTSQFSVLAAYICLYNRYVMNLRMWWRKGASWSITMAVTSSPRDGSIVWLFFRQRTLSCTTGWVKGNYFFHLSCFLSAFSITSSFPKTLLLWRSRGYTGSKLSNNMECEIFQVLLEEAKESYSEETVVAMRSDTVEDIDHNVAALGDWVRQWHPTN